MKKGKILKMIYDALKESLYSWCLTVVVSITLQNGWLIKDVNNLIITYDIFNLVFICFEMLCILIILIKEFAGLYDLKA